MTRIIVISDNHGSLKELEKALSHETYDLAVHCGDYNTDPQYIRSKFDHVVLGNTDYDEHMPLDQFFSVEGVKFWLTHGHMYLGFGNDLTRFNFALEEKEVDAVLFGHIHTPISAKNENGRWLINPGSISQPRQTPTEKTYMILEVESGEIKNIVMKTI